LTKYEKYLDNLNNCKPKRLNKYDLIDKRYQKVLAWSDNKFKLNYPQFYSKKLLNILERYLNAMKSYLAGHPIKNVVAENQTSILIIKRLVRDVFLDKSMEHILRSLIGNKGKLGLKLAAAELKSFYFENKKLPKTKEEGMITIRNSLLTDKNWKKFGIISWGDLLLYTFGEVKLKEIEELEDQKKFIKAIMELKAFKKYSKRLPKYDDKKLKWIASSVSRGIWKKFGIDVWNDLMKYTFGEVNLEHNVYEGIEGFNKAKKELLEFYEKLYQNSYN